jgi:hypothetical protein
VKTRKSIFLAVTVLLASAVAPAQAASVVSPPSAIGWLMLPFALVSGALLHLAIGRTLKVILSSLSPLSEGELEIGGYERRVYGTAVRPMQEIVLLAMLSGLAFWFGLAWSIPWGAAGGVLLLGGAIALDLMRWERVSISVTYVWFQRGLGQRVHQVALENIRDVNVVETDEPGFSLRHLNHNRLCRLTLRMQDKRVVALPKTDAYSELDAVEASANLVRERLMMLSGKRPASARLQEEKDAGLTTIPAVHDREMMRELKRLREQASAATATATQTMAAAAAPKAAAAASRPVKPAPAPALAPAPRPVEVPRVTDVADVAVAKVAKAPKAKSGKSRSKTGKTTPKVATSKG